MTQLYMHISDQNGVDEDNFVILYHPFFSLKEQRGWQLLASNSFGSSISYDLILNLDIHQF